MAKKICAFLGTLYWDHPSQKEEIEKDVCHILPNKNDITADWARYEINGSYNQLSKLEAVMPAVIYETYETTETDGSKKIRGWLRHSLKELPLYNQDGTEMPKTSQLYWINKKGQLMTIKDEAVPGYCLVCWEYDFGTRRYRRYFKFYKKEQENDLEDHLNRIR